jgi:hypothetical protein
MTLPNIRNSVMFLLFSAFAISVKAQNVAINNDNSSADASAALDVKSTSKGVLVPRMTAAQKAAISSPATGLMVYQTDGSTGFYYYSGSAWVGVNALSNVTTQGNTFNGNSQLVQTNSSGELPALSASNLTDINGANITSSTISLSKLSATGTAGSSTFLRGDNSWGVPTGTTNSSLAFNNSGTLSLTDTRPATTTSSNAAWLVGGNTLSATGSLGTTSNNHVDLVTNNTVRGRLTNLGEFFIGTTNTTLVGDLLGGVSNATFPWAVNGYSSFNGSGVYGAIQGANSTTYAAVQGENNSTTGAANSAAIRGINNSLTAGNAFRAVGTSGPRMGVAASINQTGTYSFAVHGTTPSYDVRTGGLFGDDGGNAMGAVGYYAASSLLDYAFYGFGSSYVSGAATGRVNNPHRTTFTLREPNSMIGLGCYGGVMGGWVRGLVYGAHVKGERYSLYVDGLTYTNQPITQIIETTDGTRIPTYTPTSTKTDVTTRGKSSLQDGSKFVAFDASFQSIISEDPDEMTITVTPNGNCNGVFVASYNREGFWVRENNEGKANVAFTWIAISTRRGAEKPEIASELLEKDFDAKVNGVMHNENDPSPGTSLWWDGSTVRFDTPPAHKVDPNIFSGSRRGRQKSADTTGSKN